MLRRQLSRPRTHAAVLGWCGGPSFSFLPDVAELTDTSLHSVLIPGAAWCHCAPYAVIGIGGAVTPGCCPLRCESIRGNRQLPGSGVSPCEGANLRVPATWVPVPASAGLAHNCDTGSNYVHPSWPTLGVPVVHLKSSVLVALLQPPLGAKQFKVMFRTQSTLKHY